MKSLLLTLTSFLLLFSSFSFADPAYTLSQICRAYGSNQQCSSVPFCQEVRIEAGCQLAAGAPVYMEAMCKLQTQQQFCQIMVNQGNCAWVNLPRAICQAKFSNL